MHAPEERLQGPNPIEESNGLIRMPRIGQWQVPAQIPLSRSAKYVPDLRTIELRSRFGGRVCGTELEVDAEKPVGAGDARNSLEGVSGPGK